MAVNIFPTASTDGVLYANAVPLTSTEAVLGDGVEVATLVPVSFGQAISAVIQLSINGIIVGNSTYIVLQMDMGNGVWVDLNWLFWNQTQGTATFVFSNGIAGATTFQQTRNSGQVPLTSAGVQGNGTNQLTLGGRIRFVGKTLMTAGSSSAPGVTTAITATIHYRLLGLR
jgi:hypothetical protein